MAENISNVRTIGMIVVIAIVTAVLATVVQRLVFGESSVAVTGGVVGAITAGMGFRAAKRQQGTGGGGGRV
jgi:hypothetical protein